MDTFTEASRYLVQGASRGLGLAFVRIILKQYANASVVATCRNPTESQPLNDLKTVYSNRLTVLPLDVSDEASVATAAANLAHHTDCLDTVINCAGLLHEKDLQPERRLSEVNPENLAHYFAVNSIGPLLVAKHFAKFFDRRKRVVLANLSARVGSIDDNRLGGWYGYRASKAAQNMFTRNLAIELSRKHRGIICVALHPGTVDTELSGPFQSRVPTGKLFDVDRAASQLLTVVENLEQEDNGGFFAWDGVRIAW